MVKEAVTGASSLSSITTLRGSIERIMETTGVHGYVLDALAWLPPEVVLVLDSVHIWFPLLTLFAFFFFGPAAAHQGSRVGNRAWLAFSTAVTVRQLVLWFVGLPPVKGMLLAVGLEIIPARRRRASRPRTTPGVGSAPSTCIAAKYEPVSNVPTAFSSRVEGEVQQKDYREFKERMEGMPARLPPVEANGEWSEMMNKSGVGFSYRAWRHVLPYGGTEYLSRTVFENATVEEMCDFFNDDDVRASWDRLLFRHRVLERDDRTGAECVFWERALPVISNRDYVFTRRTWKDGETYWAITKGCVHSQTPVSPNLKRVDPYFSSWRMRAVPGPDGRLTSAECILSHFEEQHVNQDVARFAVKCGMWGVVKNMDVGFRKFQKERVGSAPAGGAISRTSSGPGGVDGATGQTVVTPGGSADGNGTNLGGGLARKIAFGTCVAAVGALAAALDAKSRSQKGGKVSGPRGGRRRTFSHVHSHKGARRRVRGRDLDLERDDVVEEESAELTRVDAEEPGAAPAEVSEQ